jgi:hypothetical protein
MNAAGLAVTLRGVSSALKMTAWFEGIVKGGQIKKDELDGAALMAQALATDVGKASTQKLDPLVAHYSDRLTKHSDRFHSMKGTDPLGALHQAQMMLGHVSTILVKAKIRR